MKLSQFFSFQCSAVFCATQVEAQTIPAPSSISISNVGQTSFDVSWTAPDGVTITGYDVEYR